MCEGCVAKWEIIPEEFKTAMINTVPHFMDLAKTLDPKVIELFAVAVPKAGSTPEEIEAGRVDRENGNQLTALVGMAVFVAAAFAKDEFIPFFPSAYNGGATMGHFYLEHSKAQRKN